MSEREAMEALFARLARSDFRRRFRLRGRDLEYLRSRGMETVLEHAAAFVDQRLAPAHPARDGKQTPYTGHPAFVAQHATGTCCRGCLEKWHGIPKGRELTAAERHHVVEVLGEWLRRQEEGAP
ncbi:MAG TPA: DUF4186 domain-containing protein [Longimicrobiaceae bacterium]|nr:DUF4186 domain-containing protein [Longimicrobiaceae bacterium]